MNISEIAKMAGVSASAVSRYFNHGYLSADKKEAIRRVIEETGYQPLIQAQVLRTRKTKTIGVILPRINSSAIGSSLVGIESVIEPQDYQILLADTHNDPNRELAYLKTFGKQRVDGIILFATVVTPRHIQALRESAVPIIVLGQSIPGVPCVCHDEYNAFYGITRFVLEKGCRRLGYIGALPQDRAVGQERPQGYCNAVRDAGLFEQAEHMAVADFNIASGKQKAEELLDACGPLDALICATDSIAVGALQYLKSRNIQVPGQMLLTGHGASEVSEVTTPTITTIYYSYEQSGADAAKLLLERMEDPSLLPKEVKLGYTIIENESTRR